VVAGPAVDAALAKSGLREHLQERPPPLAWATRRRLQVNPRKGKIESQASRR